MTDQILIALISFAGTLAGSLAGIFTASRLSNYRIEQLEKKVDKHNNLVERVYLIEQHEAVNDNKIKTAEHRIADLETNKTRKGKYNIMSKIKICLKKPCLKRAFRTFIQTALGYVITNVTLALSGLDFNDGDVVKNALIGLAVAAVAAGASAVMNLKEGEDKDNE